MKTVSLALLAALIGACVAEFSEPRTGIKFAEKSGGATLERLGVRTKGPIKVYAVGEYSDGTYVLKMSYGVGAQKMSSALVDALKPRCSDAKSIEAFEACLLKGLPNGAPKGTKLAFSTGGGKLGVAVNDKAVGSVGSKVLASAFSNIYSDENAVCAMSPPSKDGADAAPESYGKPVFGALAGAVLGYKLGKQLS